MSPPAATRLVQLFERELRILTTREPVAAPRRALRVSGELDRQVVEFAAQVRTSGSTPEQMLVELKSLLSRAAPEVPGSQRNEFLATVTGRAIDAFFRDGNQKKD